MQFALRHVPGVRCAHADWETDSATVRCDSDVDREALLAVLRTHGYEGLVR